MYPWFMESVWWVFKQLYDSGLVYKGYKVPCFTYFISDICLLVEFLESDFSFCYCNKLQHGKGVY